MKIKNLLLALLVLTLGFASCKKASEETLTSLIPANANYVVYMNTKTLAQKSAYDIFENAKVMQGVNMAKAMLTNKDAVALIDKFTKDVNALGVNIKGNCYAFSDMVSFGLILEVNDAKKFKQALVDFSATDESSIKVDNGIYSLTPGGDSFTVIWDNEKLLLYGAVNLYTYRNSEASIETMGLELFKQSADKSINTNNAFVQFMSEKQDISFFYSVVNFETLQNMAGIELPVNVKEALGALEGTCSSFNVIFDKGAIKADSKVLFVNAEAEKKYKDLVTGLTNPVNTQAMGYIPEDAIFAMAVNIDGKNWYDMLSKFGVMTEMQQRMSTEEIGQMKTIIANTVGNISFSLNNIDKITHRYEYGDGDFDEYDENFPIFSLFSEQKDGQELLSFIGKITKDELVKIDENTYSIEKSGSKFYLGLKNNQFYITNDQEVYVNLKSDKTNSYFAKLGKDKHSIVAGDLKNIKKYMASQKPSTIFNVPSNVLIDFVDLFDTYEFTMGENFSGNGEVKMTDKNENSLAVIFKYVDKMVNSNGVF